MTMRLHANIISWSTRNEEAQQIAASLVGHADQLTVVYSTRTGEPLSGAGDWVQVPDEDFYGRKHAVALRRHQGGIFLQIQADASCPNWPALLQRCRGIHAKIPLVGVWSAEVDNSGWDTEETGIGTAIDPLVTIVAATDAIVWSMAPVVADYARTLDFSDNNLGWGADWAAVCHAYCNGLFAVRDAATPVHHPPSRGYSGDAATQQMRQFISGLRAEERVMNGILRGFIRGERFRRKLERARIGPPADGQTRPD
jgi:hypothetical protein